MSKKPKQTVEFRYYEIPQNMPVLALLGQEWVRKYGVGIDFLHFHNLLEVGYCHEGEGELIYDGESIPYKSGTFTIIPANFPHTTNSVPGTYSRWEYLFIDIDILKQYYEADPVFIRSLVNRINAKAHVLETDDYPSLSRLVLGICDEMRYKKDLYIESARNLVVTLLLHIARLNKEDSDDLSTYKNADNSAIAAALMHISENYADVITVSELAKLCHMSETHFRRLFEKIMNMKPVEYINLIRVQMACEYMKKHDSSMSNVAIKNGFQTTSTMNRNFNKFLGITPYQWKSHPENYEARLLNYRITAHKGW